MSEHGLSIVGRGCCARRCRPRLERAGIWQDSRFHLQGASRHGTQGAVPELHAQASPEVSNTQALIDKVAALMERQGVSAETVRIADENVGTGISSDLGEGDGWPRILAK